LYAYAFIGGANEALNVEFRKKFAIQCGDSLDQDDMSGMSALVKVETPGAICLSRMVVEYCTVT
jgi:hypothetical protein